MVDCTAVGDVTSIKNVYSNLACLSPISMWVIMFIFSAIIFTLLTLLRIKSKNPFTDKDGKKVGGKHQSLEYLWVYFLVLTGLSFIMIWVTHWASSQALTIAIIGFLIIILSYIAQYVVQKNRIYKDPETPPLSKP